MRHLLTHTGGWTGDHFADTGRGDDALAKIVASMVDVARLTPLGEIWSYRACSCATPGACASCGTAARPTGKSQSSCSPPSVASPSRSSHVWRAHQATPSSVNTWRRVVAASSASESGSTPMPGPLGTERVLSSLSVKSGPATSWA